MSYYYDLSSNSSVHGSEDEDDSSSASENEHSLHGLASDGRCILHVDVDCFYCQCEIQDRQIPTEKPFAIGQKHIIVTSNYAARAMGVKKLQSRTAALEACPQLLIIEGSDLEPYRIHARKIYQIFRKACKSVHPDISVRRGFMDEMVADLSLAVVSGVDSHNDTEDFYIYGENKRETITLTEDQTGACSKIVENNQSRSMSASERTCAQKLHFAAQIALRIRQQIVRTTGFTTTMGLSTNPLLAKIASGLKKPATVNVLYPWRSQSLLESMPLRMIPGVGRTTVKALQPCLERGSSTTSSQPEFWTCRDLLSVSRHEIVSCLERVPLYRHSSEQQADIILQKCKGIDPSQIHDDEGGAPKTVSVENSFYRGTLIRQEDVCAEMKELYRRLSRLLQERQEWSHSPNLAYATTIRLTFRVVDEKLVTKKRRPFVTRSKQTAFEGSAFAQITDSNQKIAFLRAAVLPLFKAFGFKSDQINVTRLNVAVTDFQDISARQAGSRSQYTQAGQSDLSTFVTHTRSTNYHAEPKSPQIARKGMSAYTTINEQASMFHENKIDPTILAQLPQHIVSELKQVKPQKRQRIDDYFSKKS